jgi:hypothetical protein
MHHDQGTMASLTTKSEEMMNNVRLANYDQVLNNINNDDDDDERMNVFLLQRYTLLSNRIVQCTSFETIPSLKDSLLQYLQFCVQYFSLVGHIQNMLLFQRELIHVTQQCMISSNDDSLRELISLQIQHAQMCSTMTMLSKCIPMQ